MAIKVKIPKRAKKTSSADLPVYKFASKPFDCGCIDQLAYVFLMDALDSSIETTMSRLRSIEKTFPQVSQYGMQYLGIVKALEETFGNLRICPDDSWSKEVKGQLPKIPFPTPKPSEAKPSPDIEIKRLAAEALAAQQAKTSEIKPSPPKPPVSLKESEEDVRKNLEALAKQVPELSDAVRDMLSGKIETTIVSGATPKPAPKTRVARTPKKPPSSFSPIIAGTVSLGSHVVVKDLNTGEEGDYFVVKPTDVNLKEKKMNINAPLIQAFIGRKPGEEVAFSISGQEMRYKVLSVTP